MHAASLAARQFHFFWKQHVSTQSLEFQALKPCNNNRNSAPEFLATWSSSEQIGSHLTSNREPGDLEGILMAFVNSINCCQVKVTQQAQQYPIEIYEYMIVQHFHLNAS
jgi:hypothetical protein